MIGDLGPLRLRGAARHLGQRLPANLRGALWVILSCLCIASMAALVKTLGARLDSFQLAFFRASLGLLSVLPFAIGAGWGVLRTRQLPLHEAHLGLHSLMHLQDADHLEQVVRTRRCHEMKRCPVTFDSPVAVTIAAR